MSVPQDGQKGEGWTAGKVSTQAGASRTASMSLLRRWHWCWDLGRGHRCEVCISAALDTSCSLDGSRLLTPPCEEESGFLLYR